MILMIYCLLHAVFANAVALLLHVVLVSVLLTLQSRSKYARTATLLQVLLLLLPLSLLNLRVLLLLTDTTDADAVYTTIPVFQDVLVAMDWTMNTLRGEILTVTPGVWATLARAVRLCQDPEQCESLFKEAHLGIKRTILVSRNLINTRNILFFCRPLTDATAPAVAAVTAIA
jgi:hypothetical protein